MSYRQVWLDCLRSLFVRSTIFLSRKQQVNNKGQKERLRGVPSALRREGDTNEMNASDLIDPKTIVFDPTITDKETMLGRAAQALADAGYASGVSELLGALHAREAEVSTGIEGGFGIPHAKDPCVTKPGLAFLHTGVMGDYLGLDDEPIQCAFVIVCPEGANDAHLDVLADLARRLMDDGFRERIVRAQDADAVVAVLAS